jgi:predicted Fe-Mo cluster-binding NifX family protein
MSTIENGMIVAIPSVAPGGLEAPLAAHFGHCDVFTLITVGENGVDKVAVVPGVPHDHGGCMAPVNLLAGHGATALIAGGMGRRPLMGFNEVGIRVFHGADSETVSDAVFAFLAGRLPMFDLGQTCNHDHDHDHHH